MGSMVSCYHVENMKISLSTASWSFLVFGSLYLVVIILFNMLMPPVVWGFEGGDGTLENPYRVSDCFELQGIKNHIDAHFILVNDIDCSMTSTWNDGAGFEPIGVWPNGFSGSLDGDGYSINDLYMNRFEHNGVALFDTLEATGGVMNVSLRNVEIYGGSYVGSLVGELRGSITDVYVTGQVFASGWGIGGLVGYSEGGEVVNSITEVVVTGAYAVGGLVGYATGAVEFSFATGNVTGENDVGGLIGSNSAIVSHAYATGDVLVSIGGSVNRYSGGLVGVNEHEIRDSYATGKVSGVGSGGGLVGWNRGLVHNSYAYGLVETEEHAGGLIGKEHMLPPYVSVIVQSFWDIEASGQQASEGGVGLTTAEMKSIATFDAANWDIEFVWGRDDRINNGYLYLKALDYGLSEEDVGVTARRLVTYPKDIQIEYMGASCEDANEHRFKVIGEHVDHFVVADNEYFLGSDWQPYAGEVFSVAFAADVTDAFLLFRSHNGSKSLVFTQQLERWADICENEREVDSTVEELEAKAVMTPSGALYYITENNTRRIFTNDIVLQTWVDSMDQVQQIDDSAIEKIPLEGVMLPKAETVLVRFLSSPKVYFLEETDDKYSPRLRHVESEKVASLLFGDAWQDYILELDSTFFLRFMFGRSVPLNGVHKINASKLMKVYR